MPSVTVARTVTPHHGGNVVRLEVLREDVAAPIRRAEDDRTPDFLVRTFFVTGFAGLCTNEQGPRSSSPSGRKNHASRRSSSVASRSGGLRTGPPGRRGVHRCRGAHRRLFRVPANRRRSTGRWARDALALG